MMVGSFAYFRRLRRMRLIKGGGPVIGSGRGAEKHDDGERSSNSSNAEGVSQQDVTPSD